MKPELLRKVIENIAQHEGRVSQMYLDSLGNCTVGVGHLIAKVDDACCLDFHRVDRKATRQEIIADFTAVKYTKRKGSLFLPVEEMDRILAYDLGKFEHVLETTFPEFHSYPEPVIIALFDMTFNLGSLTKWPKLVAAVKAHDWPAAAKESARYQVGSGRNQNTEEQFLAAA